MNFDKFSDRIVVLFLSSFLLLAAIIFNFFSSFGVLAGSFYIPFILTSFYYSRPYSALLFAFLSSVLVISSNFSLESLSLYGDLVNNILSTILIWIVAFISQFQRSLLRKVQKNADNFSSAFKYSATGISLVSLGSGKWLEVNNAMCDMVGYSKEELLEMKNHITHEDDIGMEMDLARRIIEGEIKTFTIEKRYRHKQGKIIWALLSVSAVRNKKGQPLYFILQAQDITKKKKLEEDLKERDERYSLVLKATRDGIWDLPDVTKDKEYWSAQWKNLIGYKANEIEGSVSKFHSLLHPDDFHSATQDFNKHIRGETSFYETTYRLKTKSGKYKWFKAKGIVSRDKKTGVKRMTGSMTDIDEQKKAQEALKKSEYARRMFIESSYDGYWDYFINANYEYMSPRFWEMLGYHPREKTHTPQEWQDIINKEDLKLIREDFDKHVKSRGQYPCSREVRYKHKDGSTVYILRKGKVVEWDNDGKPIRMIGTHTDLTQRKQIENELRKSRQRFMLATEGARDGIWDWYNTNDKDEIRYWSPQLYKILGYEQGEILSSYNSFVKLLHPEDIEKYQKAVKDHFENDVEYDIEIRLKTKNDGYKWFRSKGKKSINDEGNIRFTGSLGDISDRKENEEKLATNLKELEERNKELDQFIHIASHDLKEPLRGMHNYASFLLEDYSNKLDDVGKERLETLRKLTQRLEKLISELVEFTSLNQRELNLQMVNIDSMLRDIKSMLLATLSKENVEIIIADNIPDVRCEKILINKVFNNLIINAIKYNEKEKKIIEIGFKKNKKKTIYYVKDNGLGIKKDHYEYVFQMFKRLHSKRKYGDGTGFGLSFSKKVVKQHGGEMWFESELGVGTTFYFTLN